MTRPGWRYLGRKPARKGLVLPKLGAIAPTLSPPRPVVDWSLSIAGYDQLGNDIAGDCTYAAAGHARQQYGVYAGQEPAITAADVLAEYAKATGYDPVDPNSDQGQIETDLLHDWMSKGFTFGGELDKIDGYAAVDPGNITQVRQAIDLFGGVMLGVALPISSEEQDASWTVVSGPTGVRGSLGGHEVWANGCDTWSIQFVSWGMKVRATWEWFSAYADEVQVVLSRDWLLPDGRSPAGVDWDALTSAMQSVKRQ